VGRWPLTHDNLVGEQGLVCGDLLRPPVIDRFQELQVSKYNRITISTRNPIIFSQENNNYMYS